MQSSERLMEGNCASQTRQTRYLSTVETEDEKNYFAPMGALFELERGEFQGEELVGKTASIRRVFGPGCNAQGLLTCGGEELARHASFDPDYDRARGWIQNRAIGPAVLSPVLISGLVGALVEAAFPQCVPVSYAMKQAQPLIVGVEVCAEIKVVDVKLFAKGGATSQNDFGVRREGHEIELHTEVVRVQDDELVAEGSHTIWIPAYLPMST